jgi:hypothetical protein
MLPGEFSCFWHLTDINNMPSILRHGLLSRDNLADNDIAFIDKSDQICTERRAKIGLGMFVPWHFMPWNPSDIGRLVKATRLDEVLCYILINYKTAVSYNAQIVLEGPSEKLYLDLIDLNDKVVPAIDYRRRHTDFRYRKDRFEALGECLILDRVKPEDFYMILVPGEEDKEILKMYQPSWANCPIYVKPGYFMMPSEFARDFCPPSVGKLTTEEIEEANEKIKERQKLREKHHGLPWPLYDPRYRGGKRKLEVF